MPGTHEQLILRECEADRWLAENGVDRDPRLPELVTAPDVLDGIRRRANARYQELWLACSTPEKLVLAQLADEGVVNLTNRDVLVELMRKGLVVNDPNPQLMNYSFREFVLAAESGPNVKEVEQAAAGGWDTLRNFVWPALFIVGLFLVVTQRKYFENVIPVVSAIAAQIMTLLKTFHSFRALWSGAKAAE